MRYLIMEKLGDDLEHSTARLRGNPGAVAEIGLQILDAMQQLHNAKYIFVDVKPANFMLVSERSAGLFWPVCSHRAHAFRCAGRRPQRVQGVSGGLRAGAEVRLVLWSAQGVQDASAGGYPRLRQHFHAGGCKYVLMVACAR